jgi:LPPG:FO 2-phospho-L-lactate transferase
MKVAALAGGVGGAKLLVGLQAALDPHDLTAIVNTADDAEIYGLHVSPDIDIVTYWLAGLADTDRGWGIKGDTFTTVETLGRLGVETWFRLGDRDLGTCLYRTNRLREGASLSKVTAEIAAGFQVATKILPMSNDPVRSEVFTSDDRRLQFQEYFVRERTEPEVAAVHFEGIDQAVPAPGVLDAIEAADRVIVCPSNPIVSIGPILGLKGVRQALRSHPSVMAISPIIRGAALKGPADRLLASLGFRSTASGVADLYRDFCNVFVLDSTDEGEIAKVESAGMTGVSTDTIMRDTQTSARLAGTLLEI